MSNIDTNKIERLSGWVNFRYKLWPFAVIIGPIFLVFAAIYQGRSSSGFLSEMPFLTRFLLLAVVAEAILAIILFAISRLYNSAVNLDTNQIRLGKRTFNLSEIDSVTLAVDVNRLGQKAISLMVKAGPAMGKVLLTQPFVQNTTAASLMYLDAAITRINIPDDFEGETKVQNLGQSSRTMVGKKQVRELLWQLIAQKTS